MLGRAAALLVVAVLALLVRDAAGAELRFARDGVELKTVDTPAVLAACHPRTIEVDDPIYGARKRYRACPLADVLTLGFGAPPASFAGADVFIRAWDGYDKATRIERLSEDGAYLAFGDADLSDDQTLRFAPLGAKKLDPGPFYLVWTKPSQRDASAYPWPYQIAEIELSEFAKKYPHVPPSSAPRDSPAWAGFDIFRGECIACHSVNGEGGKVGPDLNVPQSIVEYRPLDQVKAYIRNPATFRYGNMPAHLEFSDAELDALIAYFQAMKTQKHDPGSR